MGRPFTHPSPFFRFLRWSSLLLLLAVGCTNKAIVRSDQDSIDPGSSVIAFSVDTQKVSKGNLWVNPKRLHLRYGEESIIVDLGNPRSGLQRVLLEVPGEAITFTEFEVDSGAGIIWRAYRTSITQPFKLTPGTATYVGRIEIEEFRLIEDDENATVRPEGILVAFNDALDDDLAAWQSEYRLFDRQLPEMAVAGPWGGVGYLHLWSTSGSPDFYSDRYLPDTITEPQKGPRPETGPPGSPPR